MSEPKKGICPSCGNKGRSGPKNLPCWCQAPAEKSIALENRPPHSCPKCMTSWSQAHGTYVCPACGYDMERGERHRFAQAHVHTRGLVTGGASPIEPEPIPPKTAEDWIDQYI